MDIAASVIAVIQLTGSVLQLCGGYIQEVKDARDDIIALQRTVAGLNLILQKLMEFLQSHNGTLLSTSGQLLGNITDCSSRLSALEEKIDLRKGKKMWSRFGLRALKWPLKRREVERVIQDLERYKSSFNLSLHVDQMYVLQLFFPITGNS